MTLDKYIEHLQKLRESHGGEIDVTTTYLSGGTLPAPVPAIRYKKILSRSETLPKFFVEGVHNPSHKGEKVVAL